ncbi:MAG: hypothetical protein K2X86_17145 [Cytophagaceae bacterium]|nr:hypothetical protein [Cytophagaceae bacterium]
MRKRYIGILALSLLAGGISYALISYTSKIENSSGIFKSGIDPALNASEVISEWPLQPKAAAEEMIKKYGQPNEMTSSMLTWKNNGIWKKTIVYREEIKHDFPLSHTDFLEQTIDYKTPADKFNEIVMYDGSVILERTKGTLSARCDKEAMNILAINLANDVAQGKKTTQEAKEFYAKTAADFIRGKKHMYTEKLQFPVSKNTADPDKTLIIPDEMNLGKN